MPPCWGCSFDRLPAHLSGSGQPSPAATQDPTRAGGQARQHRGRPLCGPGPEFGGTKPHGGQQFQGRLAAPPCRHPAALLILRPDLILAGFSLASRNSTGRAGGIVFKGGIDIVSMGLPAPGAPLSAPKGALITYLCGALHRARRPGWWRGRGISCQ